MLSAHLHVLLHVRVLPLPDVLNGLFVNVGLLGLSRVVLGVVVAFLLASALMLLRLLFKCFVDKSESSSKFFLINHLVVKVSEAHEKTLLCHAQLVLHQIEVVGLLAHIIVRVDWVKD